MSCGPDSKLKRAAPPRFTETLGNLPDREVALYRWCSVRRNPATHFVIESSTAKRSVMEKKLRWARSNIMQPQEGDDDCWAAVIEAALAFFNQQINNRPLRSVVHQF